MAPIPSTPPYYPANIAVTPAASDTVDLPNIPPTGVKLFVGTGGDVTVNLALTGTNKTFKNIPSGTFLPIMIKRLYVTGTTAADMLAVWSD